METIMADSSKITVAQIAAQAGVSPATVSRVLNHRELVKENTVRLVEDAMKLLGASLPAYQSSTPEKHPVIILNIPSFNNIFYTEVIRGATASANAHGCHLLINQSPLDHGSLANFCELIRRTDAAGVILLNQISRELLIQLERIVPLIQCCEFDPEAHLPYVGIDDRAAAQNATEYLISRGRNKIAFINSPLSYKYARERKQGFLDALANADIHILPQWIIQLPDVSYEMAYASVCRLLTAEVIPNAFFAASDTLAAAAIRAARHYHYNVPKDIAVIGFDNIDLASMYNPPITTVNQPRFQEGFSACEILLERIASPGIVTRSILLDTELIVRESSN